MRAGEGAAIFFLVLSSFAASVVAPTKAELEAMYAAAAQELNGGHYRDALRKLDELEARQPDMAAAQNLRGVAWMRLTEYRKAEAALRKAREIDPDFWEARYNLAEVPFLTQDWTESRRRFSALLAEPNEHLQGATSDLVRFKILLTYLLEGKEKMSGEVLEKLQASSESPALYYVKAAFALRDKDRRGAKEWMATAGKEFSPQLNKLFAESFYEVGWLPKPEGATPVALEVTSPAERVARAQADLARAERAYRARDLEGARQLLDAIDATAPNQAVVLNLRGEILLDEGKIDEAETALRNALAADPQLLTARYNLARVPFATKDYATARKQWEALLGAVSGGKEEEREQLIRYQIFLTLLLEGREGAAQKAMDEFKMMDGSPALYYAQAAWAFQHGNSKQGKNWMANASNLFSAELNRRFGAPFSFLGWAKTPEIQPASVTAVENKTEVIPRAEPSKGLVVAGRTPAEAGPTPKPEPTKAKETPPPILAQTSAANAVPSPSSVAEASATPESSATPTKAVSRERKRRHHKSVADEEKKSAVRIRRAKRAKEEERKERANSPDLMSTAAPTPAPTFVPPVATPPPPSNLGDVVRNFFFRPKKRIDQPPIAVPPAPGPVPTVSPPAPGQQN